MVGEVTAILKTRGVMFASNDPNPTLGVVITIWVGICVMSLVHALVLFGETNISFRTIKYMII